MLSLAKACFRTSHDHAFAAARKHGTHKNNVDAPLGLISAFQAAIPLGKFGAQGWIPAMVAVGMTRELGPLMDSGQAVPKRAACSWVGKPQRKESTPL